MVTNKSTTLRAVAYYRCSTTKQEASIPEQRDWCRAAASREGVDVVAEFEDDGISGSEMAGRSGLQNLAEFCESQSQSDNGRVRVLLCWDADRLSRASSRRTLSFLDRLAEAGVTHVLTSEGWVDLDDENDLLIFNIKQDTGRSAYSRSVAKTVARNGNERAKAGLWVAGKPPYGYRVGSNGRLEPVQQEAAQVRAIFAAISRGDSLGDVCRDLAAAGVVPPGTGRKARTEQKPQWRRDSLHRILTNRVYVGDLVWNRTHQGKYQRIAKGKPERTAGQRESRTFEKNDPTDIVVVEGAHPAIIDRATFAAVGEALRARRWKRTAPTAANEWIFSGMIRCGDCGAKMYGRTETHRRAAGTYVYRRYFCSASANGGKGACRNNSSLQEAVLAAVLGELKAIYADPERLQRLDADVAEVAGRAADAFTTELSRLADAIKTADAKIADGEERLLIIPPQHLDGVTRVLDKMKAGRAALADARAALTASVSATNADAAEVREALALLGSIEDAIEDVPPREARRVVERLVRKVTVVFDHTRPANQSHVAYIDIDLHPDLKLLLPGSRKQQLPLVVRIAVAA